VNLVDQIDKIHGHIVQGLNLLRYGFIAQFQQRSQTAPLETHFLRRVLPVDVGVTFGVYSLAQIKLAAYLPLNKHKAGSMHHKFIRVTSADADVNYGGKFIN